MKRFFTDHIKKSRYRYAIIVLLLVFSALLTFSPTGLVTYPSSADAITKNPDFEIARENGLPENWFRCTGTNCQSDEVSWASGLSDESYSGIKSLFFNATDNPDQKLIVSSPFAINASKTNVLELMVKPSISSACGLEAECGFYVEFELTDETFSSYFSGAVIISNTNAVASSVLADPNVVITSVNYTDAENGWKRIRAELQLNASAGLNYGAIALYQNPPDVTGTILVDNISFYDI